MSAADRRVVAGIDIGTTQTKVIAWSVRAVPIHSVVVATPYVRDASGAPGIDVDSLVAGVCAGLRELTDTVGPVASVGIASMAEVGVALGRDVQPLSPAIPWTDRRAAADLDLLLRRYRREDLHRRTGLRAEVKHTLVTWLWMRREAPELLAPGNRWAGIADAVAASLTGRVATVACLACRTLAFDVRTGTWDAELLRDAGVDIDVVPPVLPAGEPVGGITSSGSHASGLRPGTPVVIAGHDHVVGAWGAGVRAPGDVADSAGTAEVVLAPVEHPSGSDPNPQLLTRGFSFGVAANGSQRYVLGGLPSSGALVEWFLDVFDDAPDASCPGREDGRSADRYARVGAMLSALGGSPGTVLALPYLYGRAAPAPDARRRLSLHRISERVRRADVLRGLLTGAACHVRWMLEELVEVTGTPPRAITVFGGSSKLPGWREMKAGVMPWPVRFSEEADLVSLGAAQLAAPSGGTEVAAAKVGEVVNSARYRDEYEDLYVNRFLPLATDDNLSTTSPEHMGPR